MADIDQIPWVDSYETQLKELRCSKSPLHRISAAIQLVEQNKKPGRINYLLNSVLFDPDPQVSEKVRELLADLYGTELSMMLKVEGADGVPLEDPWLIPCMKNDPSTRYDKSNSAIEIEQLASEKNIDGLHQALRDSTDSKSRLSAAKVLGEFHNSETAELLAMSVILDPDEQVQQASYESLYKVAGVENAESLLNKFGSEDFSLDDEWLITPEDFDLAAETVDQNDDHDSIFGIHKSNYFNGLYSLVQKEQNPVTRIKIINKLIETNDIRVNEALAQIYLFDEDKKVREITQKELDDRLGTQVEEFLDHIRSNSEEDEQESEEPSENEGIIEKPIHSKTKQYTQMTSQESVIKEGSSFNSLIFIAGVVILGMILFLIFR